MIAPQARPTAQGNQRMTYISTQRQVDSYSLSMTAMHACHLDALHRLSACVGWPHRRSDWAAHLETGLGIVAVDEMQRVHGSAMCFPYGDGAAAVGMVIANPKLRSSGLADILAREAVDRSGGPSAFLNACQGDVLFYRRLGAKRGEQVFKYEGVLKVNLVAFAPIRDFAPGDFLKVLELDQTSYDADRSAVLSGLLATSDVRVIERAGQVVGFAMRRRFGRGYVIGPITAELGSDAVALATSLLADLKGQFVRIDTRHTDGVFQRFLGSLGLRCKPDVVTMTFGRSPRIGSPSGYALSSHSTG